MSWTTPREYCASVGGRLPTEAEWERAARGGVADLDYPWGNDFADAAATQPRRPAERRAHSGRAPGRWRSARSRPTPSDCIDVSGNVWEWTADWYDLHYYSRARCENPTGPASGRYKVIRGGSWADTETRLRTVYFRNFTAPDTAQPTVGFRCVRPAS